MTITFTLKDGLTFQDGSPLTSADIKATWDRGVSPTSVYSNLVFDLMTVTSPEQITAPDEKTVVLTLEQPTAFALKMLATNVLNIMSAASIEEHSTGSRPDRPRVVRQEHVRLGCLHAEQVDPGRRMGADAEREFLEQGGRAQRRRAQPDHSQPVRSA